MATILRFAGATAAFLAVAATGHLLNAPASGPSILGAEIASAAPAVAIAPQARPRITDVMPTVGELEEEAPVRRGPADRIVRVADCAVDMSATRRGAGLARLVLSAPCRAGERLTVQHDALAFTVVLGADGALDVEVPALSVDAIFFAFFDDATGAMAEIRMPAVAALERAGVMWQGGDHIGIHASEFGAPFGAEGHIWTGAPGAASRAMTGEGGFAVRLGDGLGEAPQIAEIYTFPADPLAREGTVDIAIEAAYGAQACGRAASATALRATGEDIALVPVSLALPDCDTAGAGGFVQLNGIVDAITVASD